jgi:hypothetical protein
MICQWCRVFGCIRVLGYGSYAAPGGFVFDWVHVQRLNQVQNVDW